MEYALEVRSASGDLFYVQLPETGYLTVGRDPNANLVLQDTFLSRTHFHLQTGTGRAVLMDAGSSNGTFVNGVHLAQSEITHGDAIRAGRSVMRLTALINGEPGLKPLSEAPIELTSQQVELVSTVARECDFAVLDGAADPMVRELLNMTGASYQSLYEGQQAADVAPFGPFLVDLRHTPQLIPQLIREGWGRGWGIFLRTQLTFDELRKHLRHFLIVNAEDGRRLLFRFYDPRVLRMFLPSCTVEQRTEFFGPVHHFLAEIADTERFDLLQR